MPVGVQCPISSSLGEFPSYWDWLWCPGLSPVLVSIALPFTFHTWCFPFTLICHWISIVFLLYADVSPPIRSTNVNIIYIYMHNPAIVYIWNDFIHIGNALGL